MAGEAYAGAPQPGHTTLQKVFDKSELEVFRERKVGMNIAVYAICKNEQQFADRWVDAMSEADNIYVLDTGSTDGTVERLRQRGVTVTVESITPWRFDVARNRSLSLVPENVDICVCTDLDEVFRPGWRQALEKCWLPGTGQARYRYTWSFGQDGSEGVVFYQEKIHRRHGYCWVHPVHEILQWTGEGAPGATVTAAGVQLNHYPDAAKPRSQYLPLLELAAAETPEDDRCAHYLGREYFYHRRWDDSLRALARHLSMPTASWRDERAASMRYMAMCYLQKGQPEQAKRWYLYAICEAPHLREAYVELARLLYGEQQWDGVLYFTGCALRIRERPMSYICEAEAWGSLPHDLRAVAWYHLGRRDLALQETALALGYEPANERLLNNLRQIQSAL